MLMYHQYLFIIMCAFYFAEVYKHQGPELQCLLKVKEDLSIVLIFQDAKNNV